MLMIYEILNLVVVKTIDGHQQQTSSYSNNNRTYYYDDDRLV
jgi:hypothetical protein